MEGDVEIKKRESKRVYIPVERKGEEVSLRQYSEKL